jgi:hypothetical protein
MMDLRRSYLALAFQLKVDIPPFFLSLYIIKIET